MKKGFQKIYLIFGLLLSVTGAAILGMQFFHKLKSAKISKKGYADKNDVQNKTSLAQNNNSCQEVRKEDKEALFIGCNGFY